MDITRPLFEFCDLRRHLWNRHFEQRSGDLSDEIVGMFLELQKLLFKGMVLSAIGKTDYDLSDFGGKPFEFIKVVLRADIDRLEILEAQESHPRAWRKRTIAKHDWDKEALLFVEFFDWYPQDPLGRSSYPHVEVAISSDSARKTRWLLPSEYTSFQATKN